MRILLVGAGGVGSAVVPIAARRDFFETMVVADYDEGRARRVVDKAGDPRFVAARVDASSAEAVAALAREHGATHVLNAVDPRFVMPIFEGAVAAGADYLDMAMSLSKPHPEQPYALTGVKLGDEQFADRMRWRRPAGWPSWGSASSRGCRTSSPATRPTTSSPRSTSSGSATGRTSSSPATTSRPPSASGRRSRSASTRRSIWEEDRGWYTTPPFSEPETFEFPEGIGPVECVNVEHEEVLLMPRWVKARRATFKYGLGDEFINVLKVLHALGLDRTDKVRVGGAEVSPRDVVAACLPDPATLGDRMTGKTCAGLWVTGRGTDGKPREVYLYHVVDNEWSMREYGSQAVVWQTAINPVVALELLAAGTWQGSGVLGPEAFDAVPFLELLTAYGSPWGMEERTPA